MSSSSPFWDVQGTQPYVIDSGRHRPVKNADNKRAPGFQGLSTIDSTLSALQADDVGNQATAAAASNARRRKAVKAAFSRLDPNNRGWVSPQDAAAGLQSFGGLSLEEQAQVIASFTQSSSSRIPWATFAAYYAQLGNAIREDDDFVQLLRHHWGFPEVRDILEDARDKFALVGMAYAFRDVLQAPGGQLTYEHFAEVLGCVGMQYNQCDESRLFQSFSAGDAFDVSAFIQGVVRTAKPFAGQVYQEGAQPGGGGAAGGVPGGSLLPDTHEAPPEETSYGHDDVHEDVHLASTTSVWRSPYAPANMHEPMPLAPPEEHGGVQAAGQGGSLLPDTVEAPAEDFSYDHDHTHEDVHLASTTSVWKSPYAPMNVHEPLPLAPPEELGLNYMAGGSSGSGALPATVTPPPEQENGFHETTPYRAPYGSSAGLASMISEELGAAGMHQERTMLLPDGTRVTVIMDKPMPHASQGHPGTRDLPETVEAPAEHIGDKAPHEAHPSGDGEVPHAPPEDGGAMPRRPQQAPGRYNNGHVGSSPQKLSPSRRNSSQPGAGGRKRAVTVGCNYLGMDCQLDGCINDSDTFIGLLTEEFGYNISDIRQLRDDHPQRMPTVRNIKAALRWLVSGAKAGDHLFFHYSGHGTQVQDTDGDEADGKDQCLVPVDYQTSGMLTDDELRRILVHKLPKGVRLSAIFDCCHSGTALDLPYRVTVKNGKMVDIKKTPAHMQQPASAADVILLSGCEDSQTSADAGVGLAGNKKAAGAMTTAFQRAISKHPTGSYHQILHEVRKFLKANQFEQIPQLSSEHFLNLNDCFMPEAQADAKAQQPLPVVPHRAPVKKALTIGCNYYCLPQGQGQLAGCINDSDTMIGILKDTFGFDDSQICRLRDDRHNAMPTKANILASMKWLTSGAVAGDELFFHYSGHGGREKDQDGDEESGMDDTMIPCDFQTAGQIRDDDLYTHLVAGLPTGVRMWVLMDCCHSGTALDLPYKVSISGENHVSVGRVGKKSKSKTVKMSGADVIMISGCQDTQTSADAEDEKQKAAGAMTTAFRHCVNQTITCEDLLIQMRKWLKRNDYEQVPQMSSELFLQLDAPFVQYEVKPHHERGSGTRDLSVGATPNMKMTSSPVSWAATQSPNTSASPQSWGTGHPMPVSPMSPTGAQHFFIGDESAGGMKPNSFANSAPTPTMHHRLNNLEAKIDELRRTASPQPTRPVAFGSSAMMHSASAPMLVPSPHQPSPFGATRPPPPPGMQPMHPRVY